MIGAIIGDIVGSRFEWNNYLSKDFELFTSECYFTDDTVLTCGVAKALIEKEKTPQTVIQSICQKYPDCGYGLNFADWVFSNNPQPYNSCGNGAAMRISPVGLYANSFEEVKELSKKMTEISHNHPDGIKGAEAVAIAIFMANNGYPKKEIFREMKKYYNNIFKVEVYRNKNKGQHGDETCQISVPQALACFFEGVNFEDVIRNAISIGGDSDTVAAIAGGIAEVYYGIPMHFINQAFQYLPEELVDIIKNFYKTVFNLNLIDI